MGEFFKKMRDRLSKFFTKENSKSKMIKNTKKTQKVKNEQTIDTQIFKIKQNFKNIYLSYNKRLFLNLFTFILSIFACLLLLSKTLKIEEAKITRYKETGSLDYKVYLKENNFYEQPYLGKGMYYIASLINNIDVDLNYQFIIETPSDMNFSYDIVAKVVISEEEGNSKLYEKEYVIKTEQVKMNQKNTTYNLKDSISVDYDYYNNLANSFKATFGVNSSSELMIYVRLNKSIQEQTENININETKQMTVTIPLTKKTLDIKIDDTGINSSNFVSKESKVSFGNIAYGILAGIVFIGAVATLLKFLELLFILIPKTNKYDAFVKKMLNEYDRLIVETETEPRLEDKQIIKIKKFEELLDARDNLKRPIMYYNIVSHQKCYFYIEKENTIYLLIIKAIDLESEEKNKKKK